MAGTVKLHRVLKAPVERVYRAFTDGDALATWLPPTGFTAHVHSFDSAGVNSKYSMSFTNFTTGHQHKWNGVYVEVEKEKKLRFKETFEDPNMSGEMDTTVEMKSVQSGTEISIVQMGIPDSIPVDGCYLGWQDSLMKLAMLVEPEIPEG